MALWEEYQFKIIPPFCYNIYRTGTIKRGDIEYKSTLFYPQTLYGDIKRGRMLYYDKATNLKDLLDNTIDKYKERMQQPVPDVWYEHDRFYVKGYPIYENGKNSYIFLQDGCPTNIYSYPNGDICIFESGCRVVIANSPEYWNGFKKTYKYLLNYNDNGVFELDGMGYFFIIFIVVVLLLIVFI